MGLEIDDDAGVGVDAALAESAYVGDALVGVALLVRDGELRIQEDAEVWHWGYQELGPYGERTAVGSVAVLTAALQRLAHIAYLWGDTHSHTEWKLVTELQGDGVELVGIYLLLHIGLVGVPVYLVAFAQAHGIGELDIEVGDDAADGSCHAHRASTVCEGNASVDAGLLDIGERLQLDGVSQLAVARDVVGLGDGAIALMAVGDVVLADRQLGETVLREELGVAIHAHELRGGEHGERTGVWDRGFYLDGLVFLGFHFEGGALWLAVLLAGLYHVSTFLQALVPGADTHLLAVEVDVGAIGYGDVYVAEEQVFVLHLQFHRLGSALYKVYVLVIVHITIAGGDVVNAIGNVDGLWGLAHWLIVDEDGGASHGCFEGDVLTFEAQFHGVGATRLDFRWIVVFALTVLGMADGDFLCTLWHVDPPLSRLVLGDYDTVTSAVEGEIVEIGLDLEQGCHLAVVVFLLGAGEVGCLVILLILEVAYHQAVLSRHRYRHAGEDAKE